ncbi:MAG TPA: glycosyltransferase family 2 protein [Candidatus Eisenbacteria bacterium]
MTPGGAPVWTVVLGYNQYALTRSCLLSVLALDPAPDHVLLVDNGSSDGTAERARREFPEIEVLALPENRYFAGGVNEGLRRALDGGAGSVLLLNNDLVLERGALGALEAALREDPARAAVGPKIFYYDPPDRIWFAGGVVTRVFGLIRHRGVNRKDEKLRDGPREVDYVSGAAALFARDALESVGLLDASYVMYAEDVDWCTRARRAGRRLAYEPRARAWHHVSAATGGGLTPLKAYFRLRSGALFLSRHAAVRERPLAWLAYGAWTAWLLLRALFRGEGGAASALLLGFADFTRILSGAGAPARTPESFVRPAPRR